MSESRIGWGLVATVLAAAASFASMARAQEGKSDAEGRKRQVVELLKSIETGDLNPAPRLVRAELMSRAEVSLGGDRAIMHPMRQVRRTEVAVRTRSGTGRPPAPGDQQATHERAGSSRPIDVAVDQNPRKK